MTPIHVVGIGLDGAAGLSSDRLALINQATILAGSERHLSYFPQHPAERWSLQELGDRLQVQLSRLQPGSVVVLVSGDPLFFGLGRQLLHQLPADALTFHPHVSSIQLAFSRIKRPWQGATLVSTHGRSLDQLERAIKQGATPIAILTDTANTPGAIARFIESLELPTTYQLWVCENLGGQAERIQCLSLQAARQATFAALNVVILERVTLPHQTDDLPMLGIPDEAFWSFSDRPGLLTKREVRVQILAELALQPGQVIWDVGAGTGSVSIEIARLVPDAQIWAIEKTTMGCNLIQQNCERFAVQNLTVIHGQAPNALATLPTPQRIFIGGSGGNLTAILYHCAERLAPNGRILLAFATLENLAAIVHWLQQHPHWQGTYQQVSLSRSAAIGPLHRWNPLNPITLASLQRNSI